MKKDSKVQNEITQTSERYNKESYSTQSKIGQNALIQSKVFEQAVNIMGDTIEDMDIEKEQKDKIEFLENKIGLPDRKVIEEMNKLGLNKISSKRKGDRSMDRLNNSLNKHKHIKNKNQLGLVYGNNFLLIIETLKIKSNITKIFE